MIIREFSIFHENICGYTRASLATVAGPREADGLAGATKFTTENRATIIRFKLIRFARNKSTRYTHYPLTQNRTISPIPFSSDAYRMKLQNFVVIGSSETTSEHPRTYANIISKLSTPLPAHGILKTDRINVNEL